MTPRTLKEYEANLDALAREAFAKHEIVKSWPGRWRIEKPGCSFFWTEIVLLAGARLLVHGDGPDVLFGNSSYRGERLLNWLANSGCAYLAGGKVIAGDAWSWDDVVALGAIDAEISDAQRELAGATDEDGEVDEPAWRRAERRLAGLNRIRDDLAVGELDERKLLDALREVSTDHGGDGDIGHPGRVPASDLYYAREGVRTLVRLLEAERATLAQGAAEAVP